ncbi:hypothetical protein CSW50_03580 [Thermus scotoductus]|uniref:Uncharacterized protein n=1 Tax=Thermus scotoductus TaxID=37636 RepID=A0A430R9Q2_THESC|nr:hypothetical protein CSW50_03580 [Thermus scotoductus]
MGSPLRPWGLLLGLEGGSHKLTIFAIKLPIGLLPSSSPHPYPPSLSTLATGVYKGIPRALGSGEER